MIRDVEKTIGNLIDKASTAQICYIDNEGYPITKAMLKPRDREGIKTFWFSTNSNKVKLYTAIKGRFYSNLKSEDFDIQH